MFRLHVLAVRAVGGASVLLLLAGGCGGEFGSLGESEAGSASTGEGASYETARAALSFEPKAPFDSSLGSVPRTQCFSGQFSHKPPLEYGIDYAMGTGTRVLAVGPGTVSFTHDGCPNSGSKKCHHGLGNVVVVDHGGDRYSMYAHLSPGTLRVSPGDTVCTGRVLAKSGDSGFSTGPHLHVQFQDGAGGAGWHRDYNSVPFNGWYGPNGTRKPCRNPLKSYNSAKGSCGGGGTYEAALETRVSGGNRRVETGGSKGLTDFLPGERFTGVIRLTNKSSVRWPDPRIGYHVGEPFLEAVDYRIESDHPHHDKKSWSLNSANNHPKNPKPGNLGKSGMLHMDGMAPGESKRVVFTLRANRYSFGYADHPDLRGWLAHIAKIYGEKNSYHQPPTIVNKFGHPVRDFDETDVFARDQWM
ncbi:MAG: M23 family metallopeptidase, partial [Bradymonadaceae bacterium]